MNFFFGDQSELCLPSQYAHMCIIWGHLNKLFYDSDHDLAHVAWKPWNFVYDRSFLRRGFYNISNSPSLLFFLKTRVHKMTQCEGFTFFWTSYARFKMPSKWRAWTFLARCWILQNYLWIYDKISTCEPKNDFLKKSWENYDTVVVQIYLASCWIGKSLSFLWKVNTKLHTHKNGNICIKCVLLLLKIRVV
jgi:hypothetical protein